MPVLDEARIDDEEAIAALDSRQTLRSLAMAGAQVRQAIDLTADAGVQRVAGGDRPRSVLVASLGGSAVVADVPTEMRTKERSVAALRFVRQMLTEAARQGLSPADLRTALERELPEPK